MITTAMKCTALGRLGVGASQASKRSPSDFACIERSALEDLTFTLYPIFQNMCLGDVSLCRLFGTPAKPTFLLLNLTSQHRTGRVVDYGEEVGGRR